MDDSNAPVEPPWAARDIPVLPHLRRFARAVVPRDKRFQLYFKMLDTPGVAELYIRSRGRLRHRRIHPGTRLVIEAFPSSGNTFSRRAFLLANPQVNPNDVCSHTHSPRVVHKAVGMQLPCIVLARDPRDAVSSMVQRFTGIHLDSAFDYYRHYYRRLLPVKDAVVVAPFQTVISDFSAIIKQCNEKFGVAFTPSEEAEVSNEKVLESIEQASRDKHGGQVLEARVSRPSSARKPSSVFLAGLTPSEQQALDGADAVWREFTSQPAVRSSAEDR